MNNAIVNDQILQERTTAIEQISFFQDVKILLTYHNSFDCFNWGGIYELYKKSKLKTYSKVKDIFSYYISVA